jgi:hypothetical protein
MLLFLVPVLFEFYIQCVLKFKYQIPVPKGLYRNIYTYQYMRDSSHLQSRTWDITKQRKLPSTIKADQQREYWNRNTTPEDKVNNPLTKHNYLQLSKSPTGSSQLRHHVWRQVNKPTGNDVTPDVSTRAPPTTWRITHCTTFSTDIVSRKPWYCTHFNSLAPELLKKNFHTLYLKCE